MSYFLRLSFLNRPEWKSKNQKNDSFDFIVWYFIAIWIVVHIIVYVKNVIKNNLNSVLKDIGWITMIKIMGR